VKATGVECERKRKQKQTNLTHLRLQNTIPARTKGRKKKVASKAYSKHKLLL
jgi:hypothetical protein